MDMDGGMGGMGSGDGGSMPLNHTGVNFADPDQAADFLSSLLDDSDLQIVGNQYALYFWYGIAVAMALAAAYHLARAATLRMRLRYAAAKRTAPARPRSPLLLCLATVTAVMREVTYPQWTPVRAAWWIKVPPVGTMLLVATHFAFVIALEFIGVDPAMYGDQYYMALSIKAAWLAVAQLPLLILLAGKNNLIGLLTGVSYERLNVLHRWTARVLLLMATVHFGTESFVWSRFGLVTLEWSTDTCPPTGIAAYALLLWLNLTTIAPLRNLSYEFFVVQHLLTFFGFIIALMMHLPTTALQSRIWVYVPIGLWFVDRLIRFGRYVWNNARGSTATLEELNCNVTKIRVRNPTIKQWSPGSFVLLSLPRLAPGQSHPATIVSTPQSHDGDLVFLLQSHTGFTNKLQRVASGGKALSDAEQHRSPARQTRVALIDGPYGHSADFAAFDTTVLIAGATGVTFTLSILLDLADRAARQALPLRRLNFIWMVKDSQCGTWVEPELRAAMAKLSSAGIDVCVRICVTCDDNVTDDSIRPFGSKLNGCRCDKSLGPCCCVQVDDDEGQDATPDSGNGEKETAPKIQVESGRADLPRIIRDEAEQSEGEMAVAVCGPLGLSAGVRRAVAHLSDDRGVHKGSGAQGIYLHVEGFAL